MTDSEGSFRFAGLRPGKAPLVVRAESFAPARDEVEIGAGARANVVLRRGATLVGRVLETTGAPAGGVAVNAGERSWTLEGFIVHTAKDGTFRLEGLPVGDVAVSADGDKKGKAAATVRTVAGQVTEWVAHLSTGSEIKGRIIDERGAPIPGCFLDVQAFGSAESDMKWDTADKEGRFKVPNCSQPKYAILVHDPKGGPGTIARVNEVPAGGPEVVIQVLDEARATAYLTGIVVGPDGRPIPAQINPWHEGDSGSPVISPDPITGAFRCGPMQPGDWRLSIHAGGLPAIRKEGLKLERDKTLDLGTIRLEAGGEVVVTLTRASGASGDPRIHATSASDKSRAQLEVAGSEARSGPLSAGRYILHVGGKGLAAQETPFEVRAGETTRLEVTLVGGTEVALRFDDPANATPSTRVQLTVRDAAGRSVLSTSVERKRRGASLEIRVGLRPGTYRVEAVAEDTGRRGSADLTVPAEGLGGPVSIALE